MCNNKFTEAEVSLRLAFFLIEKQYSKSNISVAIDGAGAAVFDLIGFLKKYGWENEIISAKFAGIYKNNKFKIGIEVHSRAGEGDVVTELINSQKLKVECKKGTLARSKSSNEYKLLREAIGQLITTKEVNANDVLAACVPASEKNHNLSKTWRASPLIIKTGIHILTIDRGGNCEGFENIVSDNI